MRVLLLLLLLTSASLLAAELDRQSIEQAKQLESPVQWELPGAVINQAMAEAFLAQPSQRGSDDLEVAAERVAEMYLLALAAASDGVLDEPEHQAGLAVAEINYLATVYLQQFLAEVDVSESALQALYERNRQDVGAFEYRLSRIVLDDRQQAEQLLAQIETQEQFGLMARAHSLDAETAEYGGELGWQQRTVLDEPLRAVLDSLRPGQIHPEPVAVDDQWHLLMLRDRRDFEPPEFDVIRPALASQAQREAVAELVNRLREQAGMPTR